MVVVVEVDTAAGVAMELATTVEGEQPLVGAMEDEG